MAWTAEQRDKYRHKKKADRLALIKSADPKQQAKAELAQLFKERKANAALFGELTLEAAFRGSGTTAINSRLVAVNLARMMSGDNEKLASVCKAWDNLTALQQKKTTLDDLCALVNLPIPEFIGVVAPEAFRYGINMAKMFVGMAQPNLVKKSIEVALTPEGVKDREMLFKATGLVPTSKGINIVNSQTNQANGGSGMPDFSEEVIDLVAAVRGDD